MEKYSRLTEEEWDKLTEFGLNFRTASQLDGGFDEHMKKWIIRMMEIAYKKGKTGKNQLQQN